MSKIDDSENEFIENPLKKFSVDNNITIQQILNNLMDGKKNLALKSHIFKPKKLASLKVIAHHLTNIGYDHSAKLITDFIKFYLEYMISYNRLGRKEIIKAFTFSGIKDKSETDIYNSLD